MKTTKRRMLAEWERQSQVQLTWPHKDTDWAPILNEITAVYEEIPYVTGLLSMQLKYLRHWSRESLIGVLEMLIILRYTNLPSQVLLEE